MKNLSIARQMCLGFGLLLALLAGTLGVSIWEQADLASYTEKQFKHPFTVTNAVARADANIARINRSLKDALLAEDAAGIDKQQANIARLQPQVLEDLGLARERFLGDKAQFDQLIALFKSWGPVVDAVIAAKRSGQQEEALKLMRSSSDTKIAEMLPVRAETYAFAMKKAESLYQASQAARDSARAWTLGLGALAILLGVGIASWITRQLVAPIGGAVRIARQVAAGDLSETIRVDGRNEIGQLMAALRDMQGGLEGIVTQVRHGADQVSVASDEIAKGNLDLSQRTEEQASAVQQTASSMEQVSATVMRTADSAAQANQLAQGASEVATRGGEVVGQVVDTMKGINESSRRISDIIGVIDGIAFQTNILALNAAVEAARAGEQGRGFAVVAAEVRSLAQRSAEAAREIKSLISASVERVEQGSHLVDQAGSTMNEIVSAIRRVTDIVGEISAAGSEQNGGIGQISQAIGQLDTTTQQNAALVEQSAAAAEALRTQAGQLVQTVSVFRLSAGAQAAHPISAPTSVGTASKTSPGNGGAVMHRASGSTEAAKTAPVLRTTGQRPAEKRAPAAMPAPAPTPALAVADGADWESF